MATAQVLRATHTIEERVRGVADTLLGVDDRGARIEDGVTSVDNRVVGVDERVAGVDNKVDQVKSSSYPSILNAICEVLPPFQGINCRRTFTNGYPHQIHLRIIISHVAPITKE